MKEKILIVEDHFVEADYLRLMLTKAGYVVIGIAHSVVQAEELIKREHPDFVLLDIYLKGKQTGIDLAAKLGEKDIPFVYLSANSNEEVLNAAKATQPYGFLVKPFREKDLLVTLQIARYRHEHSLESSFRKEVVLQKLLNDIITDSSALEQKLLNICRTLQPYIPFDYITAGFNTIVEAPSHALSFLRLGFDEYQMIGTSELITITGLKMPDISAAATVTTIDATPTLYNDEAFAKICMEPSLHKLFADTFQIKAHLCLPVYLLNEKLFGLCLYSRRSDTYNAGHIALYDRLKHIFSDGMESILHNSKKDTADAIKANDRVDMIDQSPEKQGFEGVIGRSHLLLNVFDLITQVAPSDTSVLILGESGTGKERIADCIHNLSSRKTQPFVKVNCATLHPTLIESELFGHEKGSFTGATDKRIGKFEKADKGTIFLDEIGEMPADLQVKLLRVLQEKYIERIGSRDVTKVDVRVIAATNRNLEKEVAEGRFRLDLYYRLNVFPVILPSLRERLDDIPALASHFIHHYNRKAGKKISGLSHKVLTNLMAYTWPGNIRELENLIERSVLLAKGTIIEDISLPVTAKADVYMSSEDFPMKTIHENERDYIIAVLKKCNGRIWGAYGAAEVLNLPPSTLKSKMKKLGIRKKSFE